MPDDNGRRLVSKSEYARHRGVSPAMVSHWTKDARIILVENRVDLVASDEALAKSLDPSRGGKVGRVLVPREKEGPAVPAWDANAPRPKADGSAAPSNEFAKVRTQREQWRSNLDELEYRKAVGQLVETAAYNKALADGLSPILSGLDSLSARLGPGLAAESDVRKVQNMLDDAITQMRQDIANTLRRIIAGGRTQ